MSKHVIDLRPDCRVVQQICESDGNVGVSTVSVGLLDELNDNYVQEHFSTILRDEYDRGYKDGCNDTETQAHDDVYQKGYEDGRVQERDRIWECIKKIVLNHDDGGISISELNKIFGCYTIQYVFKNYTLQQIIEKLDAYEEKQKADNKIKVKDEVIWTVDESVVIIVTRIYTIEKLEWCDGFSKDGKVYSILTENARKTGRQFDIESILEAIGR